MMPPTTTGTSVDAGFFQTRDDIGNERQVRAGQDRQSDDVRAFLCRRSGNAFGREADAVVDHSHAGIAGARRDLLGTIGVAIESRLADQQRQPAAEFFDTRST